MIIKNIKQHLISLLSIMAFLIIAYGSDDEKTTSCELNVSVEFTGTQFIVTNNDNFDYYEAQLEVNNKYKLFGTIRAGQTYTVGLMQFADTDGNRFSLMQKPQTFSIWCNNNGNRCTFFASFR